MSNEITQYEREIIESRLRGKWTIRKIARHLKRDHSIIGREVRRNRDSGKKYLASIAQKKASARTHLTNTFILEKDECLYQYVVKQMTVENWSPEQISGRLIDDPPAHLRGKTVSYEAIYQFIYNSPSGKWLYKYLKRKKRPVRQRRYNRKKQTKNLIPQRISIHERPEIINQRKRFGDWESDTVQFTNQRTGLSVQYERKALLVRIHKVANRSAQETHNAISGTIDSLPQPMFKSMTFDNGKEGACHVQIRDDFNISTFFCDSYKSWQKGGVENINGLIRYYLPRSTNMDTTSDEDIFAIQEKLNNRPRKKLRFKTPNEILRANSLISGALNP